MKKRKIFIICIIILSVIAIIVGICIMKSDNKRNRVDGDNPVDEKVEDVEVEWIDIPPTQEESDENGKQESENESAEPNVNSSTTEEGKNDSEAENNTSQKGQNQTGQNQTDQNQTNQDQTDQNQTDQNQTNQNQTNQDQTGPETEEEDYEYVLPFIPIE